jgi:hypothetical protein
MHASPHQLRVICSGGNAALCQALVSRLNRLNHLPHALCALQAHVHIVSHAHVLVQTHTRFKMEDFAEVFPTLFDALGKMKTSQLEGIANKGAPVEGTNKTALIEKVVPACPSPCIRPSIHP